MTDLTQRRLHLLTLEEKAALCSGGTSWSTQGFPEKAIPPVVMTDGTYGVRYCKPGEECVDGVEAMTVVELNLESDSEQLSKYHRATCFPSPSAFACSWDRALIRDMAAYIAQECRTLGVDILLAPAINIRRDPRGGRGFEYYSEDPFLTAELGAAFVEGLQSQGVGACLKHFACNNSEYQRTLMDSIVDERALREVYLYAFRRILKKSNPWAVMSSYNKLNGEAAAESPHLLDEILRREWGYDGAVISDWGAIKDRVASLLATGDLEMPRNVRFNAQILRAVREGVLPEACVDSAVGRILQLVERVEEGRRLACAPVDFKTGYSLSTKVAEQSCVLLKNENNVLPLPMNTSMSIVVVGDIALHPRYQGGGCAVINPTSISVPYSEITRLAGENASVCFAQGYTRHDETTPALLQEVRRACCAANAVVVFAGVKVCDDTEGFNRTHIGVEESHVQVIRAATEVNRRVIVVLNNGEALELGSFIEDADAVLECFFNGQGGGTAVANLLFGLVNPSGKLTVTFPRRVQDLPAYLTFPGAFGKHVYTEGMFTGYRYYDKRALEPRFPFGFGLSYTTFSYKNLRLRTLPDSSAVIAEADVTNTGARAGREVVQLYVHAVEGDALLPEQELKGFASVTLAPGETGTVRVELQTDDAFAHYDVQLKYFTVQSGRYELRCGASSRDIRLCGLVEIAAPRRFKPFYSDTLHRDLFEWPKARELYLGYLRRIGVLRPETNVESAVASLSNMFWGLYRALIALSIADPAIRVDRAELDGVLAEINAACAASQTEEITISVLAAE